jgi:hypothetical protein
MKSLQAVMFACVFSVPAALGAGDKKDAPPLTEEHWNASRTLSFKTPAGWSVTSKPGEIETTEARGDGLILRIYRRRGGLGLDAMHAECMLMRLAGPMDTFPGVDYEYDFIGGEIAGHRILDSAFVVLYDAPIEGERQWRQRNLTLVNDNETVCAVTYAPNSVFKKSKAARKLLTSLVESLKWP